MFFAMDHSGFGSDPVSRTQYAAYFIKEQMMKQKHTFFFAFFFCFSVRAKQKRQRETEKIWSIASSLYIFNVCVYFISGCYFANELI